MRQFTDGRRFTSTIDAKHQNCMQLTSIRVDMGIFSKHIQHLPLENLSNSDASLSPFALTTSRTLSINASVGVDADIGLD